MMQSDVVTAIKSSRLNPINRAIFSPPPVSYNEMLNGLFWIPKEGDNPKLPCTLHCPGDTSPYIMIYCHTLSSDLGRVSPTLEELAKEVGIYVLAFEYSGYGLATKDNIGASEIAATKDIETVFMYVREKLQWPAERIIIYGKALGCGVASNCAKFAELNNHRIMGLVLQSGFTCLRDLAFSTKGIFGCVVANRFHIREILSEIHCPLLLIHGKKDQHIPYGMSVTLMEEYHGNEIKLFHPAVDGAHHDLSIKNDIANPLTQFFSQIEEARQKENIIIPNIPKHDYHAWLESFKEL